jgi:hypothetical protein
VTQQNSNTLSFINSKFFAISVLAHAENFSAFFLTSHTKNIASPPAGLKELDPVAYVRFASVYTNFKEAKDFEQFVDQLNVPSKK